jgi:hypothetical protein
MFPPATGGCSVGILDYYNFTYHPVSNAPLASAIEVSISSLPGSGFSFTRADGNAFTAAAGQTVQFEIDYNLIIDPAPIITGGDMNLDPPSGNVTVTEYFCNDVSYIYTGFCSGSLPETLTVGTAASGFPSSATIVFAKPALTSQAVGILFTLNGGTSGASFDGLDSTSQVLSLSPEPASAAGLLAGLLTLAGGYKLRKRRNR